MKTKYLLAASILMLTPTFAQAADWEGLYLGAQIGEGEATDSDSELDGLAYGITGGYNWLTPNNFLIGVEASWTDGQIDFTDPTAISDNVLGNVETAPGTISVGHLITIGPRLGYVKDKLLIYGEGGFASATLSSEFGATSITAAESSSSIAKGYFLGAGFDYAFSDKFTFGAEYNRMEYNDFEHGGVQVRDASMETIVARITYKFEN